jgi:RNA polymerase sigma-70 factor (ECF subfamily)
VRKALASLDEEHRELIVLRDLEGLAYEEIVTITGLPDGTVKSRLHRARAALKEAIEKGVGWKISP